MIIVSHTQGQELDQLITAIQRSVFDTECFGPSETLAVGHRYLNTPPAPFQVTKIVIPLADVVDLVALTATPVVLDLRTSAGVSLLNSPLIINAETKSFPSSVLLNATLPQLAQIHAHILDLPAVYASAPKGLRVQFVGAWLAPS